MNNWEKIENVDNSKLAEEKAEKAKHQKLIISTSIGALALFIIMTVSSKTYFDKQNNYSTQLAYSVENSINTATSTSSKEEIVSETVIDYTNAEIFYNNLNNIRKENPEYFKNCFNTYDEVKDYIDFVCYFDSNFTNKIKPTSITDSEDFNTINYNYYKDCAKYKIKPELHTLFNNNSYLDKRINTVEDLAYDLYNSKGNDYSRVNSYYSELVNDLMNDEMSKQNLADCPGNEVLISICKNYDHIGNSHVARKHEPTNRLNIKNNIIHYVCPDSAFKSITIDLKKDQDIALDDFYLNVAKTR